MRAQETYTLSEPVVGRHDEPSIAQREEVLRGIEAERARDAARACPFSARERRSERLRRVLDHGNPTRQELDRGRATEQMNGNDGLRPRSDACRNIGGVEIEGRGVDVAEHRGSSEPGNRLCRRIERERWADDLITRSHAERVEREYERVRSVADADRMSNAEV